MLKIDCDRYHEEVAPPLTLGGIIAWVEQQPDATVFHTLHHPHSYRGYYQCLAFEPAPGTMTKAELLSLLRSCNGVPYGGYKGGFYFMGLNTDCFLANWSETGSAMSMPWLENELRVQEVEEPEGTARASRDAVADVQSETAVEEARDARAVPVDPVSTHHVHRGAESLPCYCARTTDHPNGHELLWENPAPHAAGAPSPSVTMKISSLHADKMDPVDSLESLPPDMRLGSADYLDYLDSDTPMTTSDPNDLVERCNKYVALRELAEQGLYAVARAAQEMRAVSQRGKDAAIVLTETLPSEQMRESIRSTVAFFTAQEERMTNILNTLSAARVDALQKGDYRKIDGQWYVCTDPDMARFVSFDGMETPCTNLKRAYDALRFYVDASDTELEERGIDRAEALRLARDAERALHEHNHLSKDPDDVWWAEPLPLAAIDHGAVVPLDTEWQVTTNPVPADADLGGEDGPVWAVMLPLSIGPNAYYDPSPLIQRFNRGSHVHFFRKATATKIRDHFNAMVRTSTEQPLAEIVHHTLQRHVPGDNNA